MNTEITIKLSAETALLYQNISEVEKQKIQLKIGEILNEELEKRRQTACTKLSELMDKASDEAQKNGLTPEILESILAEND